MNRILYLILIFPLLTCSPQKSKPDSITEITEYEDLNLGMFVHYQYPAKEYRWGSTMWADTSKVNSLDELANNLDVEDLVEKASAMRAQYVIFTTWHANMNALYPSEVIPKWMPDHTSKRDVIGELVKELNKKGIKLILYIHPSDGHDFTLKDQERTGWNDGYPYKRWNKFINEVIAELAERYGENIFGFFIDGGIPSFTEENKSARVNPSLLRKTIKKGIPNAVLIQNSGLNKQCVDYGCWEGMQSPWPASDWLMCQRITSEWWAKKASVTFNADLAYKYTVLQASVNNRTGGGAAWSFGPHPGGRWETGVGAFCERLGYLVDRSGSSLLGTRPSKSFITQKGTPLVGLSYVATESKNGNDTYLHILLAPKGKTITLPPPVDGKKFNTAHLLDGTEITIEQDSKGITLKVPSADTWDDVDTIIVLKYEQRG